MSSFAISLFGSGARALEVTGLLRGLPQCVVVPLSRDILCLAKDLLGRGRSARSTHVLVLARSN